MTTNRRIEAYLSLVERYPHIVEGVNGGLPVITDPAILYQEQERLYQIANSKGQPHHWYDLGIVAEDAWVVILRDLVRFPNGKYGGYIRTINRRSQLERSGTDVVIAVRVQGRYLLVRHFRHEERAWLWEFPRGFGEAGLTPEENARKEVLEETGLSPQTLQQLNAGHERVAFFLADCEGKLALDDDTESISQYRTVDSNELKTMIRSSELTDMYTLRTFALLDALEKL